MALGQFSVSYGNEAGGVPAFFAHQGLNMNAIIAAAITAGTALVIGFLGVLFSINYRLGRLASADEFLREDGVKTRELVESSKREIQEQLRSDVQQLRSENELTREQMRSENEQTREQLRSDVQQLRSENELTREQMRLLEDRLREEMRLLGDRLREEMRLQDERIREEMRLQEERIREQMRTENEQLRELVRSGKRADARGNPPPG